MDIKERITQLRKERKWSLSKLAKETGISETAVYNWYNEKNYTPSRDAIEDVCGAFGITLAEFYANIDEDKLSESELQLLQLFRDMPDTQKETVITIVKSLR